MKEFLPQEIVEDILLRLSPESLIRFKCVCKSWYALITDPFFINKHLHISINNSKISSSSKAIFLRSTPQELSLDDIFSSHFHWHDLFKQVLSFVTLKNKGDGNIRDHFYAIQEFELPPVPKIEQSDFPVCLVISHCNGYDSKANDSKVVKLFYHEWELERSRAYVYSLRTDSWREINIDIQGKYCADVAKGVYCKDFYYWWNSRTPTSDDTILSFDMHREEFHSIPLPDHIRRTEGKLMRLALWNESVVFFHSPENTWFSTSLEMWLMVEDNSTEWIKHLTIGPFRLIKEPLVFWKDDELLMELGDGRIITYNIYTQRFRKIPIQGAVLPGTSYAGLYIESSFSHEKKHP